jgi:hypothetical protein
MSRRSVQGALCIGLALVGSYAAYLPAGVSCHQDAGTEPVAPRLCATVGSEAALGLTPLVAVGAIVLLLALRVRTWILVLGTTLVLLAEGALFAIWIDADNASRNSGF